MTLPNQPLDWDFDPNDSYFPIFHQGEVVGFFKLEYANRIVEFLNEDERLRKALKLACYDLISQSGGNTRQVDELVEKYIASTERPKQGTAAIAALLDDRQKELDVSDQEFIHFCNSYRLTLQDLKNIYAGEKVDNSLLAPLSRILGKSTAELMAVRDGYPEEDEE